MNNNLIQINGESWPNNYSKYLNYSFKQAIAEYIICISILKLPVEGITTREEQMKHSAISLSSTTIQSQAE